jgi:protein TonB
VPDVVEILLGAWALLAPFTGAPQSPARSADPAQTVAGQLDLARAAYEDRQLGDAERALAAALELVRRERDAQALERQASPLPPSSKTSLRLGRDVPPPKRTRAVDPAYPPDALRGGIAGLVAVEAVIGRDGKVRKVDVVKSVRGLDDAARAAVRQWEFEPTRQNGQPVEVVAIFVLDFSLRSEPIVTNDIEIGRLYAGRQDFVNGEFVLARALETVRTEQRWFGRRPSEGPVRVGWRDPASAASLAEPKKTRHVPPAYPKLAQVGRVSGMVVIEAVIDREGHVGCARVLRSVPLLDQAALDAVRQWEFTPTTVNGVTVEVLMTVTANFTLTGGRGRGSAARF